jgi:hypothetical protein
MFDIATTKIAATVFRFGSDAARRELDLLNITTD